MSRPGLPTDRRTTPLEMATLYQREAADFHRLAVQSMRTGDHEAAIRRQGMAADCYRLARAYHDRATA